jgi:excisionase family DNA binding protein
LAVPQLLTPAQVGALTGQHRKTILTRFRRGELPGIRLGPRTVRFDSRDVQAYIDARRTAVAP